MKLGKTALPNGYEFFYERKNNKGADRNAYNIAAHTTIRTPVRAEPIKLFDFKADFARTTDLSNANT